jgi:hypothetical protein
MSANDAELVSVDLTSDEVRLVIAALRQFEPYWPSDMDDLSRTDLLTGVRTAIDRVINSLET